MKLSRLQKLTMAEMKGLGRGGRNKGRLLEAILHNEVRRFEMAV